MSDNSNSNLLSAAARSISGDPFAEVQRRVADQAPAWGLTRIAALQNLRALWAGTLGALKHDRDRERRQLGDAVTSTPDDEMQDFSIHIEGDKIQEKDTTLTNGAKPTNGRTSPLAMLALGAALPIIGAGLFALWQDYTKPTTTQPPVGVPHNPDYAPILLPGKPPGVN